MSLWTKPLSSVTYDDIDAFCRAGYSEGLQLDYKQAIPSDLAKTAAAFANTRGGLLVLGVEADKTTNQPILPIQGMPTAAGLSERIMQTCRDAIYPGILPETSPVIANPTDAGRVFIVVRINESIDAPHSMTNGTRVYVRTNDTNNPIDLAHIDRIEALLNRRRLTESRRAAIVAAHRERSTRRFLPTDPLFWLCCVPAFPDAPICPLDATDSGPEIPDARRCPEGYFCYAEPRGARQDRRYSGAGRYGDLYYSKSFRADPFDVPGDWIAKRLWAFLLHAQAYYGRVAVQHPGMLHLELGLDNVGHLRMKSFSLVLSEAFPDHSLRIERVTTLRQLEDNNDRLALTDDVVGELFHAFDLNPPAAAATWTAGALVPA